MDSSIDWSRYRDVAGQLPSLQAYTQFCLFFRLRDSSSNDRNMIMKRLEDASIELVSMFPWLSGQVVNDSGPRSSGIFKIIPYQPLGTGFDVLITKHENVDYSFITDKKAPMGFLDGCLFSPKWDLTRLYDSAKTPLPVMVLQANFLNGGMILTFAAAHNAMDMNGLGRFIGLFGKIFKGYRVSDDEIESGNKDRMNLVRLLGQDEAELDHSLLTPDPHSRRKEEKAEVELTANQKWAYVRFAGPKLAKLKEIASLRGISETRSRNTRKVDWISTDDALSAFLWQRITISRLSRILSSSSGSISDEIRCTLCRTINARKFLEPPIPELYMGHMVSCTFNSVPLQVLTTCHLSEIAYGLREKLNQHNDHSIRSFYSFIDRQEDKSIINYTARMDLSRDILISSGAGLAVYAVDFGPPLDTPDYVRRPKWDPAEGIAYLLPKTRDGHLDVALCLRGDDWSSLNGDGVWNEFSDYIG